MRWVQRNSRSGKDEIARQEGRSLAQERNGLPDAEDLVFGRAVLHRVAVELGPDVEALRILDRLLRHDSRAVRRPAIKALSERPLAAAVLDLPVAMGDIIADSIAKDIIKGFVFGHIRSGLANDDDQLALVIKGATGLSLRVDGDGLASSGE